MTRLTRILGVMGLASVYLMQVPCTFAPVSEARGGFNLLIEPDLSSIAGVLGLVGLGT